LFSGFGLLTVHLFLYIEPFAVQFFCIFLILYSIFVWAVAF
jgi:hypothetical protein